MIPTTRTGAKTELDSNGPKTELDSNDSSCSFPIVGLVVGLVLFSDCDRRERRRLSSGSLISGFFFPFWFASSLFYRRPLVVFVSVLVVISDCGSGCGSALWSYWSYSI